VEQDAENVPGQDRIIEALSQEASFMNVASAMTAAYVLGASARGEITLDASTEPRIDRPAPARRLPAAAGRPGIAGRHDLGRPGPRRSPHRHATLGQARLLIALPVLGVVPSPVPAAGGSPAAGGEQQVVNKVEPGLVVIDTTLQYNGEAAAATGMVDQPGRPGADQ
jgi:hypothetical protein